MSYGARSVVKHATPTAAAGPIRLEQVSCNLCSADDARHLYTIDGFRVVRCRVCSLVYVNPRLAAGEVEQIYARPEYFQNQDFYSENGSLYGYAAYVSEREEIERSFERVLTQLERFLHPGTLLEVGSGLGFFLAVARARGWRASGLEVSAYAAEYARRVLHVDVSCARLEAQTFPLGSFDACVLLDVIEHFADPLSALRICHGLMAADGVLVVATPNVGSAVARLMGARWEDLRRITEHLYLFSRQTLRKMLRRAGFEVLGCRQYGRYFTIGQVLRRAAIYQPALSSGLLRVSQKLGLDEKRMYVIPLTKIVVFARKGRAEPGD
jgi:2-polyprenyl-3-methyl-5-hydroxy-6-metoxy-1,4-benzoquinol methylase